MELFCNYSGLHSQLLRRNRYLSCRRKIQYSAIVYWVLGLKEWEQIRFRTSPEVMSGKQTCISVAVIQHKGHASRCWIMCYRSSMQEMISCLGDESSGGGSGKVSHKRWQLQFGYRCFPAFEGVFLFRAMSSGRKIYLFIFHLLWSIWLLGVKSCHFKVSFKISLTVFNCQ